MIGLVEGMDTRTTEEQSCPLMCAHRCMHTHTQGFSGMIGLVAGAALKKIGQALALLIGLAFIFLQVRTCRCVPDSDDGDAMHP